MFRQYTGSHIAPFTKESALGPIRQVRRARNDVQSTAEIDRREEKIWSSHPVSVMYNSERQVCKCNISENGCLDNSLCYAGHSIPPMPLISRWCDATTNRLYGCGHLIFWSGWARPTALAMTKRYPYPADALDAFTRSDKSTQHKTSKFTHTIEFDSKISANVIIIHPVDFTNRTEGLPTTKFLRSLPQSIRIGYHTLNPLQLDIFDKALLLVPHSKRRECEKNLNGSFSETLKRELEQEHIEAMLDEENETLASFDIA